MTSQEIATELMVRPEVEVSPRYDLSPEELVEREARIVDLVRQQQGDIVCSVWAPSTSPYADVVRTRELEKFPEMLELMRGYEDESVFLLMVDARPNAGWIARGTRIASPIFTRGVRPSIREGSINIPLLQGMIDSGQVTGQELIDYYAEKGINLDNCVSVETNLKIRQSERLNGVPLAQLGYLTMFNFALGLGSSGESDDVSSCILAHINEDTKRSFEFLGLGGDYEPLVGREDLHTPTSGGVFDDSYIPVAFFASQRAKAVFGNLAPFMPPEIHV